ncbi:hypothetical protein NOCA2220002 [metagenome]|uniref:PASTA domain-containing protein n=1 Tax=metagenome TaxID=256318 RepID=A0A2P2BYK3_9ZZZZ
MEFDQYVAARRTTLVRATVLLGCPETEAPLVVNAVVARAAREIQRAENPDPDVYRALMSALAQRPGADPQALPIEDTSNAAGLAVRRDLAALEPLERAAVVLMHYADLTLRETSEATRAKPALVHEADHAACGRLEASTSDDARRRLEVAADTVEAQPSGLLTPAPPPLRWPWVAAAVCAVVVGAAVLLVTRPETDKPDASLDADQIPSLFAYDADGAKALLEQRGLTVTLELTQTCEPNGRALSTDPPTGARFEPGDDVVVYTAATGGTDCMAQYGARSDAWRFIDFANGRGPAPPFADRVYLISDGSVPEAITRAAAQDPSAWGGASALDEIRRVSSEVLHDDTRSYIIPTLTVAKVIPPTRTCGVDRPAEAGTRAVLRLTLRVASDPETRCPLTVDLYRSREGIDAVVLYTGRGPSQGELLSPPPWVKSPRG